MSKNEPRPPDVLQDEILADAQRQAERVLKQARREAAAAAEAAAAELEAWRARQLAAAQAEAQRRAELILAGLSVEAGRLRAGRIDALLQSIYDEARQRLVSCEGLDLRRMLINLTVEAIRGMAGNRFTVSLPAVDRQLLGSGEIEAIRRMTGRPELELEIVSDPGSGSAGPVVRGSDGREVWDNRLAGRLARLWPALRCEMAVYTALIEPVESNGGETP